MIDLEKDSEFLFYRGENGNTKIQILVSDEMVWASQKKLAEIFNVEVNTINYHLTQIFESGELNQDSVIRKIRITANDGKNYPTMVYNLDVIIAVGYRVNSYQATRFRIWATGVLKEYLIKGFVLDDERLKSGKKTFGKDYFDELLERIRDIRASERRFYQKITDIYAQCSSDYDSKSQITQTFFATVQNKLEYAITKMTASEIIKSRADSKLPNMGLTTWKQYEIKGKVIKSDVLVAKNYLSENEISELNIVVNMYLDYAELQAKKQREMKMVDWIKKLDVFLEFNEYDILKGSGKVSALVAKSFAEKEYEKFRPIQDKTYESDFDKVVKVIREKNTLPSSKEISESEPKKEELSNFDQNLKKALSTIQKTNIYND
ncbi:virulence RhuM family protein [Arenimonas sp.]|nr:virulence RhuM family protein [Candidatus Parcubacteria bacterium]